MLEMLPGMLFLLVMQFIGYMVYRAYQRRKLRQRTKEYIPPSSPRHRSSPRPKNPDTKLP